MHYFNSDTAAGTAGGTLLGIILHINGEDVVKTIVLAAIGAVISFGVSVLSLIHISEPTRPY